MKKIIDGVNLILVILGFVGMVGIVYVAGMELINLKKDSATLAIVTRKLANAEKREKEWVKATDAASEKLEREREQHKLCKSDLKQTRAEMAEAVLKERECPSNCSGVDCRRIKDMLEGFDKCLLFVAKVKETLKP
jgi:F0F1-type ATP synthase membrane subunit b/b'